MNKKYRNIAILILILNLFCATIICNAQDKTKNRATTASILDMDRKLDAKITVEYLSLQGKGFLKNLWNKTGYEFTATGGAAEFNSAYFSVGAKHVSIRSMMESYASYYRVSWKKTKLGYSLVSGDNELDAVFAPHNQFQVARNEACMNFLNGMKNMSPESQNRIGSPQPFGAFPPEMKVAFKKMVVSLENEIGEQGGYKPGVYSSELPSARLSLSTRIREGFTQYNFDFTVPSGGGGFSTTDYEAGKEKREGENDKLAKAGRTGAVYNPEKYELSQKELNKLSVLKQTVSLNMKNATLVQILTVLHDKYNLSILGSDPKEALQKANVSISSLPLLEAMKILEKTYKKTKWMWTRSDFLVVRGPGGLIVIDHTPHPEGELKFGH